MEFSPGFKVADETPWDLPLFFSHNRFLHGRFYSFVGFGFAQFAIFAMPGSRFLVPLIF